MKRKPSRQLERWRLTTGPKLSDATYGNNGCFAIPFDDVVLVVVASDGGGWDHVSVHVDLSGGLRRVPSWNEMCYVKSLFFKVNEWVVQYHPAEDDYIDVCEYCLHLWRPQDKFGFPLPPRRMV